MWILFTGGAGFIGLHLADDLIVRGQRDILDLHEHWNGAAVFVSPDDQAALSPAPRRLIDGPHERRAAAHRAMARAVHFGIARTVDTYVRMSEALIA